MSNKYILDENGEAIPCNDLLAWAKWYERADRRVASWKSPLGANVSTVFLTMDHSFHDGGAPVLWETMIFGGQHDQYQERYTTRAAALQGHERAVQMVKDSETL